LIGTLEVPNTGGLDSWQLVRSEVVNAHGIHDLFFVFKGRDATKSDLFKFDYWQFESAASARE
ncbi:MAG: carbohydrate-binding protein, partial [Bacillota bacterium]